jgi:hypothetical protein
VTLLRASFRLDKPAFLRAYDITSCSGLYSVLPQGDGVAAALQAARKTLDTLTLPGSHGASWCAMQRGRRFGWRCSARSAALI